MAVTRQNKNRKMLRNYFTSRKNMFYGKKGSGRKWSEMTPTQRNYVLNAIAETTLSDEERESHYVKVGWHYGERRDNSADGRMHWVQTVIIDIKGRGEIGGVPQEREEYRINSVTFANKNSFQFLNALTRNLYTLQDLRNKNLATAKVYGVKESTAELMNEFTVINAVPSNFPSKKKAMENQHFHEEAKRNLEARENEMFYRIKAIKGFDEALFKEYTNEDPKQFFALTKKGNPRRYRNGKHVFKSVTAKRDYYALANDVIEQVVGFNDDELNELFGSDVNDHFFHWLYVNHRRALHNYSNVTDNTKAKWYIEYVKDMNAELGREYRPPRVRIINPDTAKGKAKAKKDKDVNKRLKDLINERFGQ